MKNAIAEVFRKQSVEQAKEYSDKAAAITIPEIRNHYLEMSSFHSECAFKWELIAN